MRVTFLIRERQLPGTALHNAAAFDAAFLRNESEWYDTSIKVFGRPSISNLGEPKPDIQIVEGGCWYPLDELTKLKKAGVRPIVRIHAAPEFLHFEHPGSCATEYIAECKAAGITVGFVSKDLAVAFEGPWMPINYPVPSAPRTIPFRSTGHERVDVGCFGAIRALKNQIPQLLAVSHARYLYFPGRKFFFHINADRTEMEGREILRELKAIGKSLGIDVVGRSWSAPEEFKGTVIPSMTFGMCASLAESFCLTAADFVSAGKPLVLSGHVPWAPTYTKDTVSAMTAGIRECLISPQVTHTAQWTWLYHYVKDAPLYWRGLLKDSHVSAN